MKNLKSREQLFEGAKMVTYKCGPKDDIPAEFVRNFVDSEQWVEDKLESFAKTKNPKPEYIEW